MCEYFQLAVTKHDKQVINRRASRSAWWHDVITIQTTLDRRHLQVQPSGGLRTQHRPHFSSRRYYQDSLRSGKAMSNHCFSSKHHSVFRNSVRSKTQMVIYNYSYRVRCQLTAWGRILLDNPRSEGCDFLIGDMQEVLVFCFIMPVGW